MAALPPPSLPESPASPSHAAPVVLFLLLAAGIAAAGALSYGASAGDLRRQKEQELAAIAELKVEEIERWRAERLADADAIAAHPTLVGAVESEARSDVARAEAEIAPWFDALREIGEYSAIGLVSESGELRFAAGDAALDARDAHIRDLVRRAIGERRPMLSDAHRHGPHDSLHLVIAAPLVGGSDARWAVLIRVDPYRRLYRMIQSWPASSPTAETLLVHRAGDRVELANELRHWQKAPDTLSVPLARSDDPAARAASGARGVMEGVDYRGHRVLAAIAPVPGSPWMLVAKVDAAEAFAPLAALRVWVGAVVVALLLAAGSGAALWWRVQSASFERSRFHDEEERRSLAGKLEHLTKFALDVIMIADQDLRIIEVNDRALTSLGYPRAELVGMHAQDLRDPATASDFDARVRDEIERGAAVFETRYRRKDGSTFPVEVSVHADVYEGRRYFHAIVRDISERKRAEEALRASEAKFRAAFEFASLGIVLFSPDGRIVETNRAFRTMLGYGDEDMRGIPVLRIVEPDDGPTPSEVLDGMREGRIERVELTRRFVRRDGSIADGILRASALRDDAGTFRFALTVVEDVSDKKRLEAQLLLADRMASIGTLAAGVAHEINNPLAFILANVDFAIGELRGSGADAEVVGALKDAKDGGERVREIVRDLKSFSRASDEARELVDVRRVLHSAIGLAANEIRHRAQLLVEPGDVVPVLANEHRVVQVLVNLLINAAQAIPDGHASENVVRAATFMAPDGRVVIEISDTGAGIPPEILPRIFDPFFTTKPVGVGTGLGLSICHGIVTSLGGDIEVDSAPGRGSSFRVRLPPGATAETARQSPTPLPSPVRRARILVVDDEVLVARAVARILSAQHDVVAHTSARAALDELLAGPDGFDLVLCDLMMPDMTGMELHARLAEVAPELADKVVFLTGGAFTPDAREFLERVPNLRLDKPFEPRALREAVASVLGVSRTARAARG